jgi:serine/threonine protein kinase
MINETTNNNNNQNLPTLKIVDSKYIVKNKLLGRGSFAQTYLAIENTTGKQLACKMISKKDLIQKINASKHKTLTK